MDAKQAKNTIEVLEKQVVELTSNGHANLAKQSKRIINRLKNRIKTGKYKES